MLATLAALLMIISVTHANKYKVTHQVYFDVEYDGEPLGRIIIGLFGEIAPKTVENFFAIATEGIDGKTYAGTKFHKVRRRFIIQGGDIVNDDGSGSISIYGSYFPDENFIVSHKAAGFISMANSGPNTNGCQFFITTAPTKWLDGKHTVFGKIVKGQTIAHRIEHKKTDSDDRPLKPIVIVASGSIPTPEPFYIGDFPEYGFMQWFKAGMIPLVFSCSIMAFLKWMMKKLDSYKHLPL